MKKGGYLIIDLQDVALSGTEAVISGIYARLEGNYRKPVLLSNITIGETEYNDCFVQVKVNDGDFICDAYGYQIRINDDDEVTAVTNLGTGLAIDEDGKLGVAIATTNTVGVIKVGTGLEVTSAGELSVASEE